MNIQAEKIGIMKLILETDNPEILKSIKKLFNKNKPADFWETLPQKQKDDIVKGIKDIDEGKIVDYEKIMSKHRQ
jgi:predicted transcriptional regulator